MMWALLIGLFSALPLPPSGRIVKGDIRVYRSPVIMRDEAGTIRGKGRYAILERGDRCREGRWWKIAPRYWVCSGWFVPETEEPGNLDDWTAAVPSTGWFNGMGARSYTAATINAFRAGNFRRLRMLRGFFPVQEMDLGSRKLLRLISGLYIDAATVERFPDTRLQGVSVDLSQLPGGFVFKTGARFWHRTDDGAWKAEKEAERYSFWLFAAIDDERVHLRAQSGSALLRSEVRLVLEPPPPPPEIQGEDEPWADVDLTNRILYAFKGRRLVRVFLISAANETPVGMHRIYWKQDHAVFDRQQQRNAYYLEAVPFVMYFRDAYALHGAYWHDDFGSGETHGCVNLAPADARWLFSFLAPALPAGYASIRADAISPGSWVRLRR